MTDTILPVDRRVSSGVQPLTTDMAKASLRFSSDSEDDLIDGWIETAGAIFEEQTGRQLVNATWEYELATVPAVATLAIPKPPLYGNVVITYDDADGNEQTFDEENYIVHGSFLTEGSPGSIVIDPFCDHGSIALVSGASWPTLGTDGRLRIRRTCGYGTTASALPAIIRSALLLLVGHFHRNRSEVDAGRDFETLPMGAQALINTFKWRSLPLV